MPLLATNALETLKQDRQLLQNIQRNLGKVNDPNAVRVDGTIIAGPFGNRVAYTSPVDPFLRKLRLEQISSASHSEAISSNLQNFATILQGTDNTDSKILKAFNDFTSDITSLSLLRDTATRQSFIDKSQNLMRAFNETRAGIKDLRSEAHAQYSRLLESANSDFEQLYNLNRDILRSNNVNGAVLQLHDQRDRLVTEIAQKFNIKVTYGHNGVALVSSRDGLMELVGKASYARFSQSGTFIQTEGSESEPSDLSVEVDHVRADGTISRRSVAFGGDTNAAKIGGGAFSAYVELRDTILKDALDAVKVVNQDIVDTINAIHSDGSPWPPQDKYESTNLFAPSSQVGFEGVLSVFAIDSDGNQLKGGSGNLHEMKLDFSKLRKANGDVGNPTLRDVANELNYMLSDSQSERRAAIGEMYLPTAVLGAPPQISTQEYLLNNIKIAGAADIQNGQFVFDLELEGNSYFDTKVEILGITDPNAAALPAANLPPAFDLKKNTITRTGREIAVPINAAPNQTIALQVRVTGENGVVREGTVTFELDGTDTATLNKRIAYNGNVAHLAGGFSSPTSHTGVGTVRLEDADGNILADNDTATPAKLVIESNTQEFAIAFQSAEGSKSNFASLLGINSLFNKNDDGSFGVRPDILSNPQLLSSGRVTPSEVQTVVNVGETRAKATFDVPVLPANLAAGDTVTIEGITLTLAAVAANENQVTLGGNFAATRQAIVNAINAHSVLKQTFRANVGGGAGDFEVEALQPGVWANGGGAPFPNINVSLNFGSSGTSATINGGGQVINPAGNLQGGTDKSENRTILSYDIGERSTEVFADIAALNKVVKTFEGAGLVFGYTGTIDSYMSEMVSLLSNQANDAKTEYDVRLGILRETDIRYKDFGVDANDEYVKAVVLGVGMRAKGDLAAELIKLDRDLIDKLARI